MSVQTGASSPPAPSPGKPWSPLYWRMLFCKNSEETPSPKCGGISRTMPDKSTRSKATATTATETPQAPAVPRKIYPIVKYGHPILEKPGAGVTKFDSELEELAEDMFASMDAAQGVGLAAPQIGKGMRFAAVNLTGGKNPEAKIILANPQVHHSESEGRAGEGGLPA